MIIRRGHWPLLIALCVLGPAVGIALGLFVEWPTCSKSADDAEQAVEATETTTATQDREATSQLLTLPNQSEVGLEELAPGRPAAIVVMKGTWCQVCQRQLVELSDRLAGVQKAGGAVFGLTTAEPEANKRLMEKLELGFPVLSDTDRSLHRKVRLWNHNAGHAVPGIVFIDADGQVEKIHRGRYPGQPQQGLILEALEEM